jgi:hypothetical protein
VTREEVTREKKQQLIKGVTDLIVNVLYTMAKSYFINGAIINVDGGMGAGHNLN